jgi:hypothetical protein
LVSQEEVYAFGRKEVYAFGQLPADERALILRTLSRHGDNPLFSGLSYGEPASAIEQRLRATLPQSSVAPTDSHFGELTKDAVLVLTFEETTFKSVNGVTSILDTSKHAKRASAKNVTRTPIGRLGSGLECDGSGHLEVRDVGLPAGNSPRTITFWLKAPDPKSDQIILFWYGRPVSHNGTYLVTNEAPGRILIGNFGGQNEPSGSTKVTDGEWHQVGLVYDGEGEAILYVDGRADAVARRPYTTTLTGTLMIGCDFNRAFKFRGILDEFAVFNRALTPAEIGALYKKQTPTERK